MNIKERRKELGLSQAELGKLVGLSQQHIQRIENGYDISLDKISLFAQALKLPIQDLLPDILKNIPLSTENDLHENLIKIDMLDTVACCGKGIENLAENVNGKWLMPLVDFRQITMAAPDDIKMIKVKGDSMEPTLKEGDWVLVDTSRLSPDSDGIFLLRLATGLAVKRLQGGVSENITIKSDNPKYDNIPSTIGEIHILGKVIYTLKAEKVG